MKKKVFFVLSLVLLFASCRVKETKIYSTGKMLDVLVVANHDALNDSTNALIDTIFGQSRQCLPAEPRFNIVRVPMDKLDGNRVFQSYRSILKCDIRKENPDKAYIEQDKWVRPQVYVLLSASCEDSLQALLRRYESRIVKEFYKVERKRIIEFYSGKGGNGKIAERVKKKFGFSISVGSTFRWLKEEDDFVWIQEKLMEQGDKLALSNLMIQTVPYVSQDQFQREQMLDRLDTMLRLYVPEATGGYPGIERDSVPPEYELQTSYVDYPGAKYCIHIRAWWGLRGTDNMMGGPLVAYSILAPDGKTIVDVIGFVYAPRLTKRDFLMKLEAMGYTIRW